MSNSPSLLAFLLVRLEEDTELVLMNLPFFGDPDGHQPAPEFQDRFLERGAVLERVRTDRDIAVAVADAMQTEQQGGRLSGPVTALGGLILKALAARYAGHPDYDSAWR